MLDLAQIESFYSEPVRPFKRNILREYIQYKILDIIFDSDFAHKLAFMGGTAIRIIHGSNRFSEDLDFDNFNLKKEEFGEITKLIQRRLPLEGYEIEIRNVFKEAFHCYISIPKILYESGISGHKQEKLMIRLDTEPQGITFSPDKIIINKFDVFTRINVVPLDLLLSQKLFAILNRKRAMGRDFFDAIFLFARTKPNFNYLSAKMNIVNVKELQDAMIKRCELIDLKIVSNDVEPFLIYPNEAKKIFLFNDFIKSMNLD
jgi:predicted nucleotidyltransferase component of viral defense system